MLTNVRYHAMCNINARRRPIIRYEIHNPIKEKMTLKTKNI